MHTIEIGNCKIGKGLPLVFMCGPCAIESEEGALYAAEFLKNTFDSKGISFIYKSSFDKANRTSISSYRGLGREEGLRILERIKQEFDVPVVTDIHSPEDATAAGEVCDVLQIPAFLCRQTDLLVAAANTGRTVSIKKGQFMAPENMGEAANKVKSCGNPNVILVERGASFGYNNLVSDMRALAIMQKFAPVCFDATHSVQLPGGQGNVSGGQREYVTLLARAAVAAGVQCMFIEAHPNPDEALSDAASMLPFDELPELLDQLVAIHEILWCKQNACVPV